MCDFPDLGSMWLPLAGTTLQVPQHRQEIGGAENLGLFYPESTSLGFRSDNSLGNILGDGRESGKLSFAGK